MLLNVSWRSLMNLFYLHLVLLLQLFSQNSIQMVFTDHAYCGVIKTRSYTNFLLLIWVQYPVFICAHFHHQIAAKYYKRFSKLNLILILQGFMSASGVGIIVFMQNIGLVRNLGCYLSCGIACGDCNDITD